MNNQSNDDWNHNGNHFNSNVPKNNDYPHKHKNSHSYNPHNPSGNDRRDSNGYTFNFNQPSGPGQYMWVPHDTVDTQMTETQNAFNFNEQAAPTIVSAPNASIGMEPKSPIDMIMLDASPMEVKTSWRQRNDDMITLLHEKKPPGLNGDLTVIRHALDNMDKDFSTFVRTSMRDDVNGDELGVNLQVLQLHLSLWVHYFESDSAEIYALRNGFNPSCLGQVNLQQVPMIVGWFASDTIHADEAYRGFILLWSKSGAKRSRQLGLATVCQLFIQSLSRPELLVPRYHDPISPVPSQQFLFERPFKTVGSIINQGPR